MIQEEIDKILYVNKNGEKIDIVSLLMENPIEERFNRLKTLLQHESSFVRLDAAVLLTAWGVEEGVDYLESFLDRDAIYTEGNYDCRNDNYDCTYDVIGQTLVMFAIENPERAQKVIVPLRKVLHFFAIKGDSYFDFGMTSFLQNSDLCVDLINDITRTMDFCIANARIIEASTLLPSFVRGGGDKVLERAVEYMKVFIDYSKHSFPQSMVIHTLRYLPLDTIMLSIPLLAKVDDASVKYSLKCFLKSSKINYPISNVRDSV